MQLQLVAYYSTFPFLDLDLDLDLSQHHAAFLVALALALASPYPVTLSSLASFKAARQVSKAHNPRGPQSQPHFRQTSTERKRGSKAFTLRIPP